MWIYLAEKMVAVCGTVLKVNTVKPLVVQLNFRCMKCGTEITRVFCVGNFLLGTELSLSSRGRMTLGVGEIF
jgi:DNA replicative helicase MCM subunit Mcm2 (Cdc46/Mcm family)